MSTACIAVADDGEFSLTAEITRRFGASDEGKVDATPLKSRLLKFTQANPVFWPFHLGTMFPPGVDHTLWRRIQLEADLEKNFRKPTYVEDQIAAGYPEGQTATTGTRITVPEGRDILGIPARAIDVSTKPAGNHLALEKTRRSEPKTRIAVQGVALRFVDEGGAAPVQYR